MYTSWDFCLQSCDGASSAHAPVPGGVQFAVDVVRRSDDGPQSFVLVDVSEPDVYSFVFEVDAEGACVGDESFFLPGDPWYVFGEDEWFFRFLFPAAERSVGVEPCPGKPSGCLRQFVECSQCSLPLCGVFGVPCRNVPRSQELCAECYGGHVFFVVPPPYDVFSFESVRAVVPVVFFVLGGVHLFRERFWLQVSLYQVRQMSLVDECDDSNCPTKFPMFESPLNSAYGGRVDGSADVVVLCVVRLFPLQVVLHGVHVVGVDG